MSNRRAIVFDDLPLFATDAEIGEALLGTKRAAEWRGIAPLYENQGLPKVDEVMGGRFTPAVRRFFEQRYGLVTVIPLAPRGAENPDGWKQAKSKHRA